MVGGEKPHEEEGGGEELVVEEPEVELVDRI